jgi:hypothetical protein
VKYAKGYIARICEVFDFPAACQSLNSGSFCSALIYWERIPSAINANAPFYEIVNPPFICHLVGTFPCFAINQSINLRAMLILLGIDGKLSAVNQPASSISTSSREISPPA